MTSSIFKKAHAEVLIYSITDSFTEIISKLQDFAKLARQFAIEKDKLLIMLVGLIDNNEKDRRITKKASTVPFG